MDGKGEEFIEPEKGQEDLSTEPEKETPPENLEQVLETQDEQVVEEVEGLKKEGQASVDELGNKGADVNDIEEFKEGEGKIEAKAGDVNETYDKEIEQFSKIGEERQEEILQELKGIRDETEDVYSANISDEEKTKRLNELDHRKAELDREFSGIDEKLGVYGKLGGGTEKIKKETASNLPEKEKDPFEESEELFKNVYKELEAYNPTMPNYFKRRSEKLGNIAGGLKGKVDEETFSFVKEAIIKDRKGMIETMAGKSSVDVYFANPGKDEASHEEIDSESYIEHIGKGDVELDKVKDKLEEVDKKITEGVGNFDTGLFGSEWSQAKSFAELAEKSNNKKQKQVCLAMALHVLDSIEKGLKDEGIKKALKSIF